MVKDRNVIHASIEVKEIIMFYQSITQVMVEPHRKILWADNSGAGLGRHTTANDETWIDNPQKQAIID